MPGQLNQIPLRKSAQGQDQNADANIGDAGQIKENAGFAGDEGASTVEDYLEIMPLGAGCEVGRSCLYL